MGVIFLYEFKLRHSAQDTAKKKKVHLGQKWRMNAPFTVGLSNFVPLTQHYKMSSMGTDHHVRMSYSGTPWKRTIGKVFVALQCSCTMELHIHHTTVCRRLREIGGVKYLDSRVSHELTL